MIDHEIRTHALISASRIQRASLCPGSVLAEEAMPPEPSSPAALRGTIIHELSEHLLAGRELPEGADSELVEVAKTYVKALDDFTQNIKREYIELSVTDALKTIHPALGGTADYVGTGGGEIIVADLKTGRVNVDPEWNPQLMTYALGAAIHLKAPPTINVRLAIYQPEAGGWKQWTCGYEDLMDWKEKLYDIAQAATKPDAIKVASEDACKYCRARSVCPVLRATAVTVAKAEFETIGAATVEDAKLCQVFAESVLEKAVEQLKEKPDSIPGWKLREGRRMTKWTDHKMAEAMLTDRREAWELKSVSAVQKLGIDIPAGLVTESRAAPSLVREK